MSDFEKDTSVGIVGQFREFTVGAGDDVFRFTKEAGWMGNADYDNAPIQFDYRNGAINLGAVAGISRLKFEGANSRILVNDGTNDRVLIGYSAGGF